MMSPQHPVEPTMQPPASGVTVRMYNPGFGDCLLLAFRAEDGSPRYLLIDCGVHHQYPDGEERLQLLARDIAQATGGRLHLVAATHEHTDHLLGFTYAREIFDGIEIDDLWLAWTENPDDPVARSLKQLYGMRINALAAAVNQLKLANEPLAGTLEAVLDFEFSAGQSDQLAYLRSRSKKKLQRPEDYLWPGETPLTLPGVKGVKIYVLGPPRDKDWIKVLERKRELYPELAPMNEVDAFVVAAMAAAGAGAPEGEGGQLFRQSCPFDQSLEISREEASRERFFRKHYGFPGQEDQGPEWRRIDTAWLAAAEQLALQINSKTNNTSLVLALELTETQPRKVLLFAADAQVGNWLSWYELSWPGDSPGVPEVTAADLLRRTVLYKVGHHGSRNATLSVKGLELMESPDLMAMIPVDQKWAKEKQNWEHPAEKLLERLKEKTRGRIIRSDQIPSGDQPPPRPDEATEGEWRAFLQGLDWDRHQQLWIQYTVPE